MSRSNRLMGVRRPAWWSYPERCENGARVGARPDHHVVVDVRLSPDAGRWHTWPFGASGGVLPPPRLPIGVVPAEA
jgi:hypothetical protein